MRIRGTKPFYKKKAIPGPSKVAVARRFGAIPGQTTPADCAYCGANGEIWWPLTYTGKVGSHMVTSGLEFDHVYPESRGGTSDPENLTLACRPCNRAKKDKVA
jgi:5-methylcytosine-specific restriction endonuclease McrA